MCSQPSQILFLSEGRDLYNPCLRERKLHGLDLGFKSNPNDFLTKVKQGIHTRTGREAKIPTVPQLGFEPWTFGMVGALTTTEQGTPLEFEIKALIPHGEVYERDFRVNEHPALTTYDSLFTRGTNTATFRVLCKTKCR